MVAFQLLVSALLASPAFILAAPTLDDMGLTPGQVLQERGCTKSPANDLGVDIISAACPDGPLPLAESCKFVSSDATGTDIYKYAFFMGGENCNGRTQNFTTIKTIAGSTGNSFSIGAKAGFTAGPTSISLETNYDSNTVDTKGQTQTMTVPPGKKSVWVTQTPYKRHAGQIIVHYKSPVNCEQDHPIDASNDQPVGNNNPVVFQHDFECGDDIQATLDDWNDKGINSNWKFQ